MLDSASRSFRKSSSSPARRSQGNGRRFRLAAWAGFFLAAGWIAVASLVRTSTAEVVKHDPRTLRFEEVRAAFAEGSLPAALELPAYYRDPELFLVRRERDAQTGLVVW